MLEAQKRFNPLSYNAGQQRNIPWHHRFYLVSLWLLLGIVFALSVFEIFIYFFLPVDGTKIDVRKDPIKVIEVSAIAEVLKENDIILSIDGKSPTWSLEHPWLAFLSLLEHVSETDPTITVRVNRNSTEQTLLVPLKPRPLGRLGGEFLVHIITGLIYMGTSALILKARGWESIGRLATFILLFIALREQGEILILFGAEMSLALLWLFLPIRLLTRWFAFSAVVHFSLSFPQPRAWLQRVPFFFPVVHLLNPLVTLAIMFNVGGNLHQSHAVAYPWTRNIYIFWLLISCIFFIHAFFTAPDALSKIQMRWIAWGSVMTIIPNVVLGNIVKILPEIVTSFILLIVPVVLAIVVLRYRLWDISLIIKASVLYGVLTFALGGIYLLIVTLFIGTLGTSGADTTTDEDKMAVFFFAALIIAFLFTPIRDHVQQLINRFFSRNKVNYTAILTDLSRTLSTSLVLDDLLILLNQAIPEQLLLEKGMVLLDNLPPDNSPPYFKLKTGQLLWLYHLDMTPIEYPPPLDKLQASGIWVCVPLLAGEKLLGIYGLGIKKSGDYFNAEDIALLETLGRQVGVALQNSLYHKKLASQVRLERELEIARQIQMSLLPASDPVFSGLEIVGFSSPAAEVGGDFYHYFSLDDNHLGIVVGDVAGKGVPAALVMAVSLSTLRGEISRHGNNPAELLSRLNHLFLQMKVDRLSNINTALLYTAIKKDTEGRLSLNIGNAGLVSPLLLRENEECKYIDACGMPLAMIESPSYYSCQFKPLPNDLILLCSDGIVEAMNEQEEVFGFERLEAFMNACDPTLSALEVVDNLREAVYDFVGTASQHDDITVVLIKVTE